MDKRKFRLWNGITSAVVLVIASFTYLSTIEPTASFWDCGEFIASSYKLEVGHPPGNPMFQLIARFFTMFADNMHAAIAVNVFSIDNLPAVPDDCLLREANCREA